MFSNRIRSAAQICSLAAMAAFSCAFAQADFVEVTITNNAPKGGTYLTPVWVGFHDGSFDSYDGGTASAPELERLAEDGNTGPLSNVFGAGGTLAGNGSQDPSQRVQGVLANGGPIAPGQTVTQLFYLDAGGSNNYFSYAAMILPSNDYYIANGNPFAHNIGGILANGGSISFDIFQVNDAGTEVNDFLTSAGNPLFGDLLPPGQSGPNEGADENGVNSNVLFPFSGFLNAPSDADTDPNFALLDFANQGLYPRGLATVTITAVPEPGSVMAIAALGLTAICRRRR